MMLYSTLFGREECMLFSSPVAVVVATLLVSASPASTIQLPAGGGYWDVAFVSREGNETETQNIRTVSQCRICRNAAY